MVSGSASTASILIVDDNPMNLGVIADYLEVRGFTILVARDGHSGLEKAAYARPDLILMDVMMPGIDGFETCRRLKADEATANIPVIFMTALAETENKLKGFEVGAVDYVTKPLQQDEILARINTHLRLRQLTEQLEQLVVDRTAELDQAYTRLTLLDRAKADFINVTSHELRTPLTVIDGSSQMLKSHPAIAQNEDLQALLANILNGTKRMADTINVILDAARIDNDTLQPMMDNLLLKEIIEAVLLELNPDLERRRLVLNVEGLAGLPVIKADPDLMQRLFYHLIVNAVKYTPDGGQITISGRQIPANGEPAQVEIVVADTGIGINVDQLKMIFEKFYQIGKVAFHSSGKTTFKGGGPGLGLAIARGIVTVHGGQIWAESAGHDEENLPGSRFYVRLPLSLPV